MKLAIGNDHVAIDMKNEIKAYLVGKGHEVIDVGTNRPERFNYPVSGYRAAKLVASGKADGGILICGTGVGISLAANKVHGIRACVCSEPYHHGRTHHAGFHGHDGRGRKRRYGFLCRFTDCYDEVSLHGYSGYFIHLSLFSS